MDRHEQIVRATVAALRADLPDGLADVAREGPRIRVIEVELNLTYSIVLPPSAMPSTRNRFTPVVIAEFHRQTRRLMIAEARAEAARTAPAKPDQIGSVVRSVKVTPDTRGLAVTIAPAWTAVQRAAQRRILKVQTERERLRQLAQGPDDIQVVVPLDAAGRAVIDAPAVLRLDPETRAAVLNALDDHPVDAPSRVPDERTTP